MSADRVVLLARPARHAWAPMVAGETVDREVDWSARLKGDELARSEFHLPPGLKATQASNGQQVTTLWISGDAAGVYEVVNRVTTAKGRELEQAIKLRVKPAG
jgi:hypothetical protein